MESTAVIQNLTSEQNAIELYVNAALKMFIARCATIIGVKILFGTLLGLEIPRFHNHSSTEQANPAPS